MRDTGKYEKKPPILRSYIVSLLVLTLCCAMFLSTTFAWFTSNVTSPSNRIETGSLMVALQINGKSIADTQVFTTEAGKPWLPGDFQVKKMVMTNSSTMPIDYALTMQMSENDQTAEVEVPEVAKFFSVYVNVSDNDETVQVNKLTAESFKDTELWPSENVLPLYDVLNGKALVSVKNEPTPEKSETEAASVDNKLPSKTTYITLALMFNSYVEAKEEYMNTAMNLDVKLTATQAGVDTEATGLLTLSENAETVLKGKQHPMYVNGNGTLVLQGVTIEATKDGQHAIQIAPGANVTIRLEGNNSLTGGKNGNGIYVGEGATLTLTGNKLTAVGNEGIEYESSGNYCDSEDETYAGTGGSGIGGTGNIVIDTVSDLTAKGYGEHAFGIGGSGADVTVKDSTVTSVRGGFVNLTGNYVDSSYNKSEPEGGAAIGGAKITMVNSTVKEAIGGSKSAGIGATFWQPVQISITGCTINKVVGGCSSAGIGGSRVNDSNPADQDVTINIADSTITAQGGYFGAGIGSGYDTHCTLAGSFPIHTIKITGKSVISATGGKYAAGIGTGYHVGGLAGMIESTVTVNAVAGESREKYTEAMGVGFGVIDKTREGKDNNCTFDYQGTEITVASATDVA